METQPPTQTFPTTAQVRRNFHRCAATYAASGEVQKEIGRRLLDRLDDTRHTFSRVLDAGAGPGVLRGLLPPSLNPEILVNLDLCPLALTGGGGLCVAANAESPPFRPNSFDLILSNLMLPWLAKPKATLLGLGKLLCPDGLLLASTIGPQSFVEFRTAWHRVDGSTAHTLPLADVRTWGDLMAALKFALPVVDRDVLTVTYPDFSSLYADLRHTGARNLHPDRRRGLTSRKTWQKMEAVYREEFARPDGSLPLTLEIIYLTGWRPHPSQPQPLAPGSGGVSLEEILNPGKK